jgi:hypothetical protein
MRYARFAVPFLALAVIDCCPKGGHGHHDDDDDDDSPPFVPAPAKSIESLDTVRSICGASFTVGGGYSEARGLLGPKGFTFGKGTETITADVLATARIFVISEIVYERPLSPNEVCVLERFVQHGGALLDARNMYTPSIFGVKPASARRSR